MKRLIFLFIFFLFFPLTTFAKLKVVATIPTFAALAQEVGKDLIEVKSIARGDQDPHFLEPKPSYAVMLNQADLVIEDGLELEIGWLPVLFTQARNPKIQPGQKGYLNASEGLEILDLPSGRVDRSQGDVHPLGNPHYWFKPQNGLLMARRIADRLKELDPANASQFEQNVRQFESRLKIKMEVWDKKISGLKGKKIITYHKSFTYFADWAGLQVVDYIEPKPGIPPNPGHLLSLIERIKAEKVPLIISENYYDPKPAQQLAEKTGAKFLILPTSVGGEPAIKTYEDLFEDLIQKMTGAL